MSRTIHCAVIVVLAGCTDDDPAAPDPPPQPEWTAHVRVDGTWVDAGQVELGEGWIRVRFTPDEETVVEAVALRTTLDAPEGGSKGWLSNGFQSWSQSGVVQAAATIDPAAQRAALAALGDDEVLRSGETHSWWNTFVDLGDTSLVAGVTSADRFKSWVSVQGGDELSIELVSGGAGESVTVAAGDSLDGERWFVERVRDLDAGLRRYAEAVPSRRRLEPAEAAPPPELGWNSWYDLWDDVTEEDVRANAPLARQAFTEAGVAQDAPVRIVIDDGWQLAWGDWNPNDKFPSGMDGLAADLTADGFEVGVWLAPLLVEHDLPLVADHPDWFVGDGTVTWRHPVAGVMAILDTTNPEANAHLTDTLRRIVGWGYHFLKIDFLFAGTFEGERHKPGIGGTGMRAFHHAMGVIRDAVGDDVLLLAVASPHVPTLRYVDSWRLGHDIAYKPIGAAWPFISNQLRGLAARWYLCDVTLCDADPPLMRTLVRGEVEVGARTVALAGGGLFLSDDLRDIDAERRGWTLTPRVLGLATSARGGAPVDPFDPPAPASLISAIEDMGKADEEHVVPRRWIAQDGEPIAVER